MGCQTTTFKTRRHELALLGRSATDEAAAQLHMAAPNEWFRAIDARQNKLSWRGSCVANEPTHRAYRSRITALVGDAVDPSGADPWMLDLLHVGQLAVIVGDALFIHGGLYDEALGAVPGEEVPRET
eukprot:s716_g15.t1